ncbi:hypothetical protein CEXT_398881 [Caerostris extrusa]|uniref:Uncharacterized protein n=1 Tax=Caerostris extrusa TaxID=172846 RepID=A0AAV4TVA2_CAEEX|nr:hypothetical protein CEXT_398881 [Caerostris extrusa]
MNFVSWEKDQENSTIFCSIWNAPQYALGCRNGLHFLSTLSNAEFCSSLHWCSAPMLMVVQAHRPNAEDFNLLGG